MIARHQVPARVWSELQGKRGCKEPLGDDQEAVQWLSSGTQELGDRGLSSTECPGCPDGFRRVPIKPRVIIYRGGVTRFS